MNLNDLNKDDREILENILLKDRKDLNKQEKLIVKARKSYIRADEYQRLVGEEIKKVVKKRKN